jgi:16S rRNA (uracil1498-N3)-methyltransferase
VSSTPRFFVAPSDITADGASVTLPPDAAHHARGVLRLRVGEAVVVHDGRGNGYRCRLTEVGPKRVAAAVEEPFEVRTEPRVRVTVAQALPKTSDKVEQVLQHGTEAGAAGFVLFGAFRSVAKLGTNDKVERREDRWRGIVRGAAEQSGRALLPPVEWLPNSAAVAGAIPDYDAALVLHESATAPLRAALSAPPAAGAGRLLVIVGPEGGLTDDEVARFTGAGAAAVSLGPRVLRTETAALVALAQILYATDADSPAPL